MNKPPLVKRYDYELHEEDIVRVTREDVMSWVLILGLIAFSLAVLSWLFPWTFE